MNIITRIITRTAPYRTLRSEYATLADTNRRLADRCTALHDENAALRLNIRAIAEDRNKWAQKYLDATKPKARKSPRASRVSEKNDK